MRTNEFLLSERKRNLLKSLRRRSDGRVGRVRSSKGRDPLWIQTATPSKEFSSSALVISPPKKPNALFGWRNAGRENPGGQRAVSLRERDFLRSSRYLNNPKRPILKKPSKGDIKEKSP